MVWPLDAVGVPTPGMDDFMAGALISHLTLRGNVFGSLQSQNSVQPSAADHSDFMIHLEICSLGAQIMYLEQKNIIIISLHSVNTNI